MQTHLPVLVPVRLVESEPPIDAARMPEGYKGATMRSLCAWLDIDKGRQVARIKRNPALSAALVLLVVDTPGGPQSTDVLQAWAIPVWASGLHTSRLPEKKQALALILQQYAFAAIERAFAQFDSPASAPPPPSQSAVPHSPWEAGHVFIDSLKAESEETRSQLAVVQHDVHHQALRIAALEARDARPAAGLSDQQLGYIYQSAHQVRQRQGYLIDETLAGLAAHFQVESIYYLPEKD